MAYRMTPARRAALRKAQAASARRRRGKGRGKLAAANRRATRNKRIALATGGLAGAAALAGGVYNYKLGKVNKRLATQNKKLMRDNLAYKQAYTKLLVRGTTGTMRKSSVKNIAPGLALTKRYGYGYKPGIGNSYLTDGTPYRRRRKKK